MILASPLHSHAFPIDFSPQIARLNHSTSVRERSSHVESQGILWHSELEGKMCLRFAHLGVSLRSDGHNRTTIEVLSADRNRHGRVKCRTDSFA